MTNSTNETSQEPSQEHNHEHSQEHSQEPNQEPKSPSNTVIKGILSGFWETGTEGVLWSLEEEPFKGYEGLHILENGDHLTVYKPDGSVLWQGIIDYEYESGYEKYPLNPQYGQQAVFGMWVHGCQKGFAIEDWAHMFFGPLVIEKRYQESLKAELRKKAAPNLTTKGSNT